MECPACNTPVRTGTRFCESCGAKLERSCPGCKVQVPLFSKYCGDCGYRLDPPSKPAPAAPAERAAEPAAAWRPVAAEAERRHVTVMFCDLVGSTTLSQKLDPENLREVLKSYQQVCAESISRYGGFLAKYIGDGVLAYFGYPSAHDDDPRRGVHAGLAIVRGIRELNDRLSGEWPVALRVRIGLHTGLVVAGEMGSGETREDLAIVGETPNIAARLESIADPDSVFMSAATHRLVARHFECRPMGMRQLKGIELPVEVYAPLHTAAGDRTQPAEAQYRAPIVGRELEVRQILERWNLVKEGEGHAVLLSGEAGIGKSRLLAALKEAASPDGRQWRSLYCSPYYQNSALHPMIDLMERGLASIGDKAGPSRLAQLEQLLEPYGLADAETVPLFAMLLALPTDERYPRRELPPDQRKKKTLDAIMHWLVADASRHPLVIVVEDLHWVDASTRELLGLLLDQIATLPVLTVFTYRPEFEPGWATHSHVTTMPLSKLNRAQTQAIIARVAAGKNLPDAVLEQIVAKTDGVPLFVEEFSRTLLDSGQLIERDTSYELAGALKAIEIPATLRDSLTARLDRLGEAKALAQLCAVLGREFSYELLQTVSAFGAPLLERDLAALTDAEIVYQRGLPPNSNYLFKHALIQEAAYDTLLKSTRGQYHGKIAKVYIERFPEVADSRPELVAHHFSRAAMAGDALGWWQRAGELAKSRSGYAEALNHFTAALELLDALPASEERDRRELEIRVQLGPALIALKGMGSEDTGENYGRACAIGEKLGESAGLFMAMWGHWMYFSTSGRLKQAAERAQDLVALSQRLGNDEFVLQAHHARWTTCQMLGQASVARFDTQQGIRLYDPVRHRHHVHIYGGHDPGVCGRGTGGVSLWLTGFPDQAATLVQKGIALGREIDHPFSLAVAFVFAAYTHQFRGDPIACRAVADEMIELSRRYGIKQMLGTGAVLAGWARMDAGETELGLRLMEQGLADLKASGTRAWLPYYMFLLAEAKARIGDIAQALEAANKALEVAEQTGQGFFKPELLRTQAEYLYGMKQIDAPGARSRFEGAIALAREQSAKSLEFRAVCSLARVLANSADAAWGRQMLEENLRSFTEGLSTRDLAAGRQLLESLR